MSLAPKITNKFTYWLSIAFFVLWTLLAGLALVAGIHSAVHGNSMAILEFAIAVWSTVNAVAFARSLGSHRRANS